MTFTKALKEKEHIYFKTLFLPTCLGKGIQLLLQPGAFVHCISYTTVHGFPDLPQYLISQGGLPETVWPPVGHLVSGYLLDLLISCIESLWPSE